MKTPPTHHREIFRYLRDHLPKPAEVIVFGDNQGKNPVPVAHYGKGAKRFYSTLGICDKKLHLPAGHYELAAIGAPEWLPNALTSSIYWLRDRHFKEWPLVCEDVVKHNARSTYRHMAFIPSGLSLRTSKIPIVHWLLGVPIKDTEIALSLKATTAKIKAAYPQWLTRETKPQQYTGDMD